MENSTLIKKALTNWSAKYPDTYVVSGHSNIALEIGEDVDDIDVMSFAVLYNNFHGTDILFFINGDKLWRYPFADELSDNPDIEHVEVSLDELDSFGDPRSWPL